MTSNRNIEKYIEQIESIIADLSQKLADLKSELKNASRDEDKEESSRENTSVADVVFIPKTATEPVIVPTSTAKSANKRASSPLKEHISVFDYFYFRRELFLDNETMMEDELETLTHLPDFSSATEHLSTHFPWVKTEEPAAKAFLEIVEKYYA
ncbi:MAG: hypothetical protein Q3998_02430 [Porphyromonas sp.]|nr:hypothetical protein [Porphyromonas sp.]